MKSPASGAACGAVLGCVAVVVWWFAVARHAPGVGRDLFPSPDGPEYFAGAVQLHASGDYSIQVAGRAFPPRYPPGFSAVLVPFLGVVEAPIDAPFAANKTIAAVLLGLLFAAGWRAGRPLAAGLATLLVATTPMFVVLARSPMADLAGTLLAAIAVGAAFRYGLGGSLRFGAVAAVGFGLGAVVRTSSVLLLPVLAVAWLTHGERRPRRLAAHAAVLAVAALAGATPLLLYCHATFGSVFASGYAVWVPDVAAFGDAFDIRHVVANAKGLGRELLQAEWETTLARQYGHGSYFGPALVGLALIAAVCARPRGRSLLLSLAAAGYGAAMLCYFFSDVRFFAPLLPLVAVFVANRIVAVRHPCLRVAVAVLLACHVFGVPGSGAVADMPRYLGEAPPRVAPRYDLLQALRAQRPGLVLCTFNAPYAYAVLGGSWTVAPANDDHDYRYHPAYFRYGASERREQVERALAAGEPVYLVADADFAARCADAVPAGWHWRVLAGGEGSGIATLAR